MSYRVHRILRRSLALPAFALLLSACDGLLSTGDRRPDEARVVVTGTSAEPLRLITSTRFTATPNVDTGQWDVNFDVFDLADLAPPIERTVQLDTDRIVVRLLHLGTPDTADIRMEVYFDGRLTYSQEATIHDSFLDFIHVFN
jgi:hypothetical protein